MPAIKRMLRNRSVAIGLTIVVFYLILFVMGALSITPFPPNEQHPKVTDRLQPPSAIYLMGSDQFGRDILSRVIRGTIYSLRVVFISVAIATVLGTAIGMISGNIGARLDTPANGTMDVFLALPPILLALAELSCLRSVP